tara:strand:- start:133937 stop:135253 length:1317 start_codon:yes stop_codon:yes gene_type:complete
LGLRVTSIFFRLAIIVVVLAIAAGIVAVMISTKVESAQSDAALMPVQIRTMEAQLRAVDRTWDGYGTARSMNDASIVAEVGGRVIERPNAIEPGQRISVGTVLLRLDSSDSTNTLNAANQAASAIEAQLDGLSVESERVGTQIELAKDEIDAAQRDLERTAQAIEAGAGSVGELDIKTAAVRRVQREVETLKERLEMIPSRRAQLLAQLAGQRASASTAQENLDRAVIRSPIAGVIQSVNADKGDWVAMGTPIARVIDLSQLEIPVRLPASAIRWIRLGDEIQLWQGDPIGEPNQIGVITRIAPEADTANRTITVYVEVEQDPNAGDRLSPGRFVLGRVRSPDDEPRFVVPRRAIQGNRVMIAVPQDSEGYRIEVRPVTTAYSIEGKIESLDPNEDQWTVITSGLSQGDLVVVSLLDQISEGLLVEVIGREDGSGTQP